MNKQEQGKRVVLLLLKQINRKLVNALNFAKSKSFTLFFVDSEGVQPPLTANVQSATQVVNQPSNIVDMQGSISQNNAESSERAVSPSVEKKSEECEQETSADNSNVEISSPDANTNVEIENVQKEVSFK